MAIKLHRDFAKAFERLSDSERESVTRVLRQMLSNDQTPGMRIHPVGDFLSISPNMDIRMLMAGSGANRTIVYVGHHDDAYAWAAKRGVAIASNGPEILPSQFLATHQRHEVDQEDYPALPTILDRIAHAKLGDDALLTAISGLSPEWQEWFFRVYVESERPTPEPPKTNSFVAVIGSDKTLEAALSKGFQHWQLFLHPLQQRAMDDRHLSIVVTGLPGTGKTVVLLRRFLRPRAESDGVRILATFSRALVREFRKLHSIAETERRGCDRVLWVDDLVEAASDGPGFVLVEHQLFYRQTPRAKLVRISEILVDELQDTPPPQLGFLKRVMDSRAARVVLAFDTHQAVFRDNEQDISMIAAACESRYDFNYVYRSSREIMASAKSITDALYADLVRRKFGASDVFALSGPPVVFLSTDSMAEQVKACDAIIRELETRYDPNEIGLIYVQYYNPAFSGDSKEEAALKNHPRLGRYYTFASLSKGREFSAGALFVSQSYLERRNVGPTGLSLRSNAYYVAATRFRDEVTITYRSASPFDMLLKEQREVDVTAKNPVEAKWHVERALWHGSVSRADQNSTCRE